MMQAIAAQEFAFGTGMHQIKSDLDAPDLDALLRPQSIAIIGVSRDQGKQTTINGSAVLESLTRFHYPGRIDLIHPEATEIAGKQVFPSISALTQTPDLIVIALASAQIPDIIAECGAKGIRGAVVMSAGFSELGAGDGALLEQQMKDAAARYGVRICGPNGLGYINVADGIFAGYFPSLTTAAPKPGGLSIITHSGAIGNSLVARAIDRGVGMGFVVSAGNEANVTLADYIHYMIDDPATRVISLYMEGVTDGMKLRSALERAAAAHKPVVIYKVGKSAAGAKAALSHTAKVAGEHALYRGMFRQLGVIEATRLDDLIEIPMLLLKCTNKGQRPPRNIGVVTISGGLGAIMADHFSAEGFALPELAASTQAALAGLPLKFGSTANPVDTTAAIQRTESTLTDIISMVASDPAIDALVFPNASRFPQRALDVANIMSASAEQIGKPLLSVWYAGSDNDPAMRLLHDSHAVPCFDDPAACARALAALRDFRLFTERTPDVTLSPPDTARERATASVAMTGLLSEPAGKSILQCYGVPLPQEAVAVNADDAAACAAKIGFPVALKIVSAGIPHKAQAGGVALGLGSAAAVRIAYNEMMTAVAHHAPGAKIEGVLVSEMVGVDLELIVGAYTDPHLGPALLVGMGGSQVEQLRDTAMCLLPATRDDCERVLDAIEDRRVKLLKPAARAALVDVIGRIAAMVHDLQPALWELDVNPVALTKTGNVVALDAMMTFTDSTRDAQ